MKLHMTALWGKALLGTMLVAMVFVLGPTLLNATCTQEDEGQEAKEEAVSVEEQMDALVELGPGVHNIKRDSKGRVQRLIAVGQARISTVLGAAKGNEVARKKAAQNARAEFVKWLGEQVEIHETSENETMLFLTGVEGNDEDTLSEAGKAVEKTSDSYESVAAGLVRGLAVLHSDVNAEEKTCTLVYGWSVANAKAAKHTATNDPGIEDKSTVAKGKSSKDNGTSDKKKIRNKKATAKEASEFLK